MVTRKRLRSILTALGLYVIAALLIGYFGVNAYTGNHGLKARQDLDQQIAQLTGELAALKAERANWERRVALLKSDSLDPDMLDERARALLDYVDPARPDAAASRSPDVHRRTASPPHVLSAKAMLSRCTRPAALSPCGDFGYWDEAGRPVARRHLEEIHGRRQQQTSGPACRAAPRRPIRHGRRVPDFSKEQELAAYREMLLIRRFEEKAGQMYGMGLIGGFCHLYIGQEAVVVGMQMALKPGDQVITGYRDHGHMLACGMDPKGVMAELTGRRGGYSKGKGGSMHMFSVEKGFFGGHGIVGAQVPLGTGLAFANRYRGNDNVCLTYFGDGAANQGQVYESFNMAKLWKLPVIYIIENNQYAMGTSVARASATTNLSQARPRVRHSRRAGRRHGRARGQGGGREGGRNGAATATGRSSSKC